MLFQAKPGGEFRPPALGAPAHLGDTEFKAWPREPIDLVDGVPFLVVGGYMLAGSPERAERYLAYCVENCDWNTQAFKPKSLEEKRKALAKLAASPGWKKPLTEEAVDALSRQIDYTTWANATGRRTTSLLGELPLGVTRFGHLPLR
jgi:hypothetical protein